MTIAAPTRPLDRPPADPIDAFARTAAIAAMNRADEPLRLTEDVYVELVCTLFSTLFPTIIMATSFLLAGAWIAAETHDPVLLILWLVAVVAALGRIAILLFHHREAEGHGLTAVRAGQLERRFAAPYFAFALFFGLFAARAFALGASDARLLIVGLLFGYGAGVATGIALRPWICIPSVLIAIVPTIGTCFLLRGPGNVGIGLLTAIFLAGGIETMLRRYQATSRQFTMKHLLSKVDRHDELTGLPNQVMLRERFGQITASTPGGEMIAIHCLAIERVDEINDSLGYPAGDALLKAIAERLIRLAGPQEAVVRLGGSEFAIVQSEILQPRRAEMLAREIVAAITKPYLLTGDELSVSAHIGYALTLQQGADLDRLLKNAHMAARRARQEARPVVGHGGPRWTAEPVLPRERPGPRAYRI